MEQVGVLVIFEVDPHQVLISSHRQIFPLYADAQCLLLKNSALAQIRQKCAEYKARLAEEVVVAEPIAGPSAV